MGTLSKPARKEGCFPPTLPQGDNHPKLVAPTHTQNTFGNPIPPSAVSAQGKHRNANIMCCSTHRFTPLVFFFDWGDTKTWVWTHSQLLGEISWSQPGKYKGQRFSGSHSSCFHPLHFCNSTMLLRSAGAMGKMQPCICISYHGVCKGWEHINPLLISNPLQTLLSVSEATSHVTDV